MSCEEKSTVGEAASPSGATQVSDTRRICPSCASKGFDVSVLGPDRCTFCDGTEGGNPPTPDEIAEAQRDETLVDHTGDADCCAECAHRLPDGASALILTPDGPAVVDATGAHFVGGTLKVETYRHTIAGYADLVWNVSRAKWEVTAGHTCALVPMEDEALKNIEEKNEWDPQTVEHANPAEPGIGAPFWWEDHVEYLLIDGTHRAVRNRRDLAAGGSLRFHVHLLSDEAAARCLISGDERLLPWRRRR